MLHFGRRSGVWTALVRPLVGEQFRVLLSARQIGARHWPLLLLIGWPKNWKSGLVDKITVGTSLFSWMRGYVVKLLFKSAG